MFKKGILATTVTLLGLVAALPHDQHEARAATVKLMPFGASIVEQTCWRAYLQLKLRDAGITNVDFVGSGSGPASCTLNGAAVSFDPNHEGHSGAKVTDYAANGDAVGWLAAAKPDLVLMHVGTNDVVARLPIANITRAYSTVLSEMRASKSTMVLVLSKLIPIDPALFGQAVADDITNLNNAMVSWVQQNNNEKSPILLVDMTGFDYKTMTKEGEHPNEAGDVFMSDRYLAPVEEALGKVKAE